MTDDGNRDEKLEEVKGFYVYRGRLVADLGNGDLVTLKANIMGLIVVDERF